MWKQVKKHNTIYNRSKENKNLYVLRHNETSTCMVKTIKH